jgi:hypothetical protein
VAVEKRNAGDDGDGQCETKRPAGQESLHFPILAQARDLPRRR